MDTYDTDLSVEFMTLEQFGELFHQKLDACYADSFGDFQK